MACETDSYTKRPLMSNDPYTEMTDEQIRNIKHVWVWNVFNIQFTMWSNTWVLLCLVVQNYCYNKVVQIIQPYLFICDPVALNGGSVAKWLACWTQAQKGLGSIAAAMLSVNSLRQTVHSHRASIYQAAKLAAALLRVARVTAGLAESNGSLPPGLWLTSPACWLPRTGISSGTLRSVTEYELPFSTKCVRENCVVLIQRSL